MSRRSLATAAALTGIALAALAAGCGGGKKAQPPAATDQTVKGSGYTFSAPAGWRVFATERGVNASGPGSLLLSVGVYKLVKPYAPARFDAAARELDRVAARLAAGREGKVNSKQTITVAGRKVRSYRIGYKLGGKSLSQQVTFVLRDKTEWLLVCRRGVADPDEPCARLLASFRLKAA